MAESNVSMKVDVDAHDNKMLTVHYHNVDSSSTQLATLSCVSVEDCEYLGILPDVLISDDLLMTANGSTSDVTGSSTHSQCVQPQHADINLATSADDDNNMYMTVVDDADDHKYISIIADSDMTDTRDTTSEARVIDNTDQPAQAPIYMPKHQQTKADLSPIYMPNERQTTLSSVYLEPDNAYTQPVSNSAPYPHTDTDPDRNNIYSDPYLHSVDIGFDRDTVYSDFPNYNTAAPVGSSNKKRKLITAGLAILGGILFTGIAGIVRISVANVVHSKTVNNQTSTGMGYFHSSPFQLYKDGPIVPVKPTRSVIFNRKLLLDTSTYYPSSSLNIFKAPRTGLYWFHLETYTDNKGRASYNLIKSPNNEHLTELNSICPNFNAPTLSRDDLRSVNESNQLYVTSRYAAYSLMNDTYATAWSGFELTQLLGPTPVAFSVVNSALLIELGAVVQFNTVLVDTSNSWDMTNCAFIAPVDGVYVLSISYTSSKTMMETVQFKLGTRPVFPARNISKHIFSGRSPNHQLSVRCTTTVSITTVISLKHNQYVQVYHPQYDNNIDHSWDSYKGFLYAPLITRHNVIWSLDGKSRPLAEKHYIQFTVSYQTSRILFRGTDTTHLVIPVSGIYYITLAAQFCTLTPSLCCTVGMYASDKMLLKTVPINSVSQQCLQHNRAVLLPLQQSDTLSVILLEGNRVLMTLPTWINLSGFLVHAT